MTLSILSLEPITFPKSLESFIGECLKAMDEHECHCFWSFGKTQVNTQVHIYENLFRDASVLVASGCNITASLLDGLEQAEMFSPKW